jgi:PTH1 family peptidyl-tRNA hydrolase
MAIKRLACGWDVRVKKKKFRSKTAEVTRESGRVILAMPQTYMNASGQAVKELIHGMHLEPGRLLVVYDDIDIPLGDIRVRKEGGPGTHKGMISIIEEIRTERFPRIRIGIGPVAGSGDVVRFVLSPFLNEERDLLEESLDKALAALEIILEGDIDRAMNLYN